MLRVNTVSSIHRKPKADTTSPPITKQPTVGKPSHNLWAPQVGAFHASAADGKYQKCSETSSAETKTHEQRRPSGRKGDASLIPGLEDRQVFPGEKRLRGSDCKFRWLPEDRRVKSSDTCVGNGGLWHFNLGGLNQHRIHF